MTGAHPDRPSAWTTLGWGVFCACSWTWCIGMFLPVVMLERYGFAGYLVFAIPNVIGCAGFGYVVSRDRSRAMTDRHRTAMRVFSVVAITFQLFFATWLFTSLVPWPGGDPGPWPYAAALGVLAMGTGLAHVQDRGWMVVAGIVYLVSITAFLLIGARDGTVLTTPGDHGGAALVGVAPVVILGFLLCPFLDLTFHRARRAGGRHAFGVFGITFTVMILFTPFLWSRGLSAGATPGLVAIGLGHLLAQLTFTVGAHLRELRATRPAGRLGPSAELLPLIGLGVLPLSVAVLGGDDVGRDTYIRFFVFYALVFPAYVLLFIGPGRPLPLSRRALTASGLAMLAAMPLMEVGFLHGRAWLLLIPAAAMVGWTLARSGRPALATGAA